MGLDYKGIKGFFVLVFDEPLVPRRQYWVAALLHALQHALRCEGIAFHGFLHKEVDFRHHVFQGFFAGVKNGFVGIAIDDSKARHVVQEVIGYLGHGLLLHEGLFYFLSALSYAFLHLGFVFGYVELYAVDHVPAHAVQEFAYLAEVYALHQLLYSLRGKLMLGVEPFLSEVLPLFQMLLLVCEDVPVILILAYSACVVCLLGYRGSALIVFFELGKGRIHKVFYVFLRAAFFICRMIPEGHALMLVFDDFFDFLVFFVKYLHDFFLTHVVVEHFKVGKYLGPLGIAAGGCSVGCIELLSVCSQLVHRPLFIRFVLGAHVAPRC